MRVLRLSALVFFGLLFFGISGPSLSAQSKNMRFAFVLLSEPRLPKGEDVVKSFSGFAKNGQSLLPGAKGDKQTDSEILEFQLRPKGKVFVMLLPAAVPGSEAQDAVRNSLSSLGTGWKLPNHKAHLIVTCDCPGDAIESLSLVTSVLAAVVDASATVGVYWGDAGATHDPKFFLTVAREPELDSLIMLWTGVSVAHEPDGRLSLLSLGMKQLGLPDLLLIAPNSMGNDSLEVFFSFLTYVAQRGKALPEGDTVGRTPTEKLPVHYVPSPIDPKTKVWRIELK
jgi:hypothetical protein